MYLLIVSTFNISKADEMNYNLKSHMFNFSFVFPALIMFIFFVLLPFFQGIPIALSSWDGFSKHREFIGFQNFRYMLQDPHIIKSSMKTFQFTVIYILFSNILGLSFALLIRSKSITNQIVRTVLFMPFVISLVLSAFMWSYLYSDVIFKLFSIPSPLGSVKWVIFGLAMIAIWRDSGYCMIIYIAALQAVPYEFYEAADLEGAGKLMKFFKITLPLIVPAFTANITLLLAWGLKVFDYPMAATNGGPGRASETIALYVYNNIFYYYKAGYGQAIALVFTLFIFIVSTLVTRSLRAKEISL